MVKVGKDYKKKNKVEVVTKNTFIKSSGFHPWDSFS